jgi:hypothetical protein
MKPKTTFLSQEDALKALEQKFATMGINEYQFKNGKDLAQAEFLSTGQMEVDAILGTGAGQAQDYH